MNVDNLGGEEVFNELEECERGNLIGLVDDLYCVIVVYSLYGKLVLVRLDFSRELFVELEKMLDCKVSLNIFLVEDNVIN